MTSKTVTIKLTQTEDIDVVLLELGGGRALVLTGEVKEWARAQLGVAPIKLAEIEAWSYELRGTSRGDALRALFALVHQARSLLNDPYKSASWDNFRAALARFT